jgi:hypothetical protein
MRFAFIRFMTLTMRRGMLVFREGSSLGNFISPGMGRRPMRVRRMLLFERRYFVHSFGSRFPVFGVLMFMPLVIFVGMSFGFITRVMVTVAMDDASLKNETHQKYEQH